MKTLTVFDLDETLVHGDTSVIWREYLQTTGVITDPTFTERDLAYQRQYAEGILDLSEYIEFSLTPIADIPTNKVTTMLADCIHTCVVQHIFPEAKTLIKQLTANGGGEDVLIISATVTFIVKAVAKELGIAHAIGVDLLEKNDRITAEIIGTPSFREGKVTRLKQWLAGQGKDAHYDHITFYTDSINDLPMCEFADEVYTVNPCKQLRPIAEARGWSILNWGQ